jgi:hypothetical protein
MFSVVDKILNDEHRKRGLVLFEDDHLVYLVRYGHTVAVWSAQGATLEAIRKEADKILGGDAIKELVAVGGADFQSY